MVWETSDADAIRVSGGFPKFGPTPSSPPLDTDLKGRRSPQAEELVRTRLATMERPLSLFVVLAALAACQHGSSDASGLDPTPCTRQVAFDAGSSTLSQQSKQSIDLNYGSRTYCAQDFGTGKSFDVIVIRADGSELSRARAEAVRDHLVSIGFPPQAMQLVADSSATSGVTIEFWPHALWRMRRNAFDRPG
jgi:hypothetical protein